MYNFTKKDARNGSSSNALSRSRAFEIAVMTMTAVMLVVISKFSSSLHHTGQAIFAMIFTIGVLVTRSYFSAVFISLISGAIYSFLSFFGPWIMVSWLVRGVTVAVLFRALSIFDRDPPSAILVSVSMTISSFATGMTHYLFLIKFLNLLSYTPPFSLVLFTIGISVASTLIASYLATKLIYPRVRLVLPW